MSSSSKVGGLKPPQPPPGSAVPEGRAMCRLSGTLELERFRTNPTRPGCKFGLEWRPSHIDGKYGKRTRRLNINVDLSVAIDVEVANESESESNRYLLVPAWCYKCDHHPRFSPTITLCWRRSFSLNEKQMF